MKTMDLSYLHSIDELHPQIELKIDSQGELYFFDTTNNQEPNIGVSDFLGLTEMEKKMVTMMKKKGFYLLGDKSMSDDYPEYFKKFHGDNISLFGDSEERLEPRDANEENINQTNGAFPYRENRELIFVRLHIETTTPQEIMKATFTLKSMVKKILGNIGVTK